MARDASWGVFNISIGVTQSVVAHRRLAESEASLRESEERFRTLFALSPMGVVMSHGDTEEILIANEEMARITGYSQTEMASMHTRDFTHPEDSGMNDGFYRRGAGG